MSDISILRTKITPPYRRDEILTRQRLIELFDDLLEKKLVIVTAPAGYGKTSLLVDLAHRHELPYCWYALDPLDKELGRFLAHFIAAIQIRYPQFGAQSLAALQNLEWMIEAGAQSGIWVETQAGGRAGTGKDTQVRPYETTPGERFLVTLVNEIYQVIREHFAIVLDDYHNLDDSLEINAFISRFIQEVDQNCHLVILSRTLLPLPDLPLMVARSQVGGIGMQELAFRPEEIQALMLQNYQQVIPAKVATELAQRTEGWITGLLLSAQSMWQGMLDRLRVARVSGVGLYEYLVHQVLEQQPPEMQDFLLKTAYLEEFNAEICAELIIGAPASLSRVDNQNYDAPASTSPTRKQVQDMQSLAQMVLSHNLFVTPVGEDGSWLRYHPLFREFLQNHLKEKQPEVARQVLNSLVRIYGERGEWERAYAACQRLDDPAATADLLELAARTMMTGGRISQFQKWLDALPPGMLERRPVLLARHGQALAIQGEPARGLRYLDQALEYYLRADNIGEKNDRQVAWIYIWRAQVHHICGSHTSTMADTTAALALVEAQDNATSCAEGATIDSDTSWLCAEAYRIRGMCQRQLGKLDDAIRNFAISLRLYQEQGNSKIVNLVLINQGTAYLDAAEFGSALSCYKQALDYYQLQNDAFALSSVLNDVAFLHHLRGEYTQAYTTFEDALARAVQSANFRVQAMALIGMGDLHLDLQELDAALDSYHQARPIIEQLNDRYLMIYLDLAEAAVARLKGNLNGAHLQLNAARQITQQSSSDYFRSLHQLESGRLALAEHDYVQAANLLGQADAGFTAGGQRIEAGRASLLLAAAFFELGDLSAAEAHLVEMFQLVDRWENQHSLVSTARLVRPFLQQVTALLTNGSEVSFGSDGKPDLMLGRKALRLLDQVDQLESNLANLQRRMRRQSSIVAPSPPHLLIQALGKVDVLLRPSPAAKQKGKSGAKSAGKPAAQLTSADWQTQVTRDLFFLILSDPRGWTKEALGELLWPDSTPAQLKLRFKNTVYRLRRALQQDVILFEGDRYSFNRSLDYEYDVEQFWEQLNQANEATTPKKKVKALQTAMQLYQGEYLPEVSGAWVLPEQERLRQAFQGAGLQLARLHLEAGQLDQALEVTDRLQTADPCLEEAYLIAMQAQATAGNRPAVARLYEKLSQTLAQELGTAPSALTKKLYQTLKD